MDFSNPFNAERRGKMNESNCKSQRMSQRATHFQEARRQRQSEIAEDYTELIAEIMAAKGVCASAILQGKWGFLMSAS